MTSLYSAGMPSAIGPSASTSPRKKPPNIAPGMLPIPPSTAAVNALRPGINPLRQLNDRLWKPSMTPAAPASIAPMAKVTTITWSTSTPMSEAVSLSSATARMARPVRERCTNR